MVFVQPLQRENIYAKPPQTLNMRVRFRFVFVRIIRRGLQGEDNDADTLCTR